MYNIAICDDDINHVIMEEFLVEDILKEQRILGQIKTFTNASNLANELKKDSKMFDIIYLDIEMPEKSGLNIGETIRTDNQDSLIIYVTNYEEYSLSAYENRPFHYLMKPIDKDKFKKVLVDAIKYINDNRNVNEFNNDKLIITINKNVISINCMNILYIEKKRNTCMIVCKEKIYTVYDTMKNISDSLNNYFYRCHQSYIVNLINVYQYKNNNYILNNGIEIPISKRNRVEGKKIFIKTLRRMIK